MRAELPILANANITIEYMNPVDTVDPTCTNDDCKAARVRLRWVGGDGSALRRLATPPSRHAVNSRRRSVTKRSLTERHK